MRRLREAGALVTRIKSDERQVLRDAIGIRGINLGGSAEAAAAFGAFVGQQMAAAGARAHDLATGREFKALGHRFSGFNAFGASHKIQVLSKKSAHYRWRSHPKQAVISAICYTGIPRKRGDLPTPSRNGSVICRAVRAAVTTFANWLGMSGFQREEKRSALARGGFHPDAAAVFLDDARNGGQADAGAFKFLGAMQPLEHAEEFAGIFHIEAHAVVADKDDRVAVGFDLADFDLGALARPGVFGGVRKEIGKDHLEQTGIALDGGQLLHLPIDMAIGDFKFDVSDDALHELIEIGALAGKFLFADPAEIEEIIDEPAHVLAAFADLGGEPLGFLGHLRAILL